MEGAADLAIVVNRTNINTTKDSCHWYGWSVIDHGRWNIVTRKDRTVFYYSEAH